MRKENVAIANFDQQKLSEASRRLGMPGLSDAIIGGLAYLFDTQVRSESSYISKTHNYYLPDKKNCSPKKQPIASLRRFIGRSVINEKYIKGTWPGYIRYIPTKSNRFIKPLIMVADINLFTTASTAYSLFFFNDDGLPADQHVISEMLTAASDSIQGFRRGNAYNFWRTVTHPKIPYTYAAPLNIPIALVNALHKISKHTKALNLPSSAESNLLADWVNKIFDKKQNPTGGRALFNLPDDADNTSMAVSFNLLFERWMGQNDIQTDTSPLNLFQFFRDCNRKKNDIHNTLIGLETGAFLTWLKDENLPTFADPQSGVIPLSINNVDIVINANVLFALSLAGKSNTPGFSETARLLAMLIKEGTWKNSSLYYPVSMVFPYAISRAIRDAGLKAPEISEALPHLLAGLLDEQKASETAHPQMAGAFSASEHENIILATALAMTTLLNIGRNVAEDIGLEEQYDELLSKSAGFLIVSVKKDLNLKPETAKKFPGIESNYWESGIIFSSSLQELAHWHSNSQTTSLVIEALAKYALCYDRKSISEPLTQLGISLSNGVVNLKV